MASPEKRRVMRESAGTYDAGSVLSPFKRDAWKRLTPAERLERSWELRERIPNLAAVHDRKLFPKP
jgi:hypothetical protein